MADEEEKQEPENGLSEDEFDRRRDLRVPLRVIRVEANSSRKAEIFFGYASNVSKSGLFIQTPSPKEVGSKFSLRFALPNKKQISCSAEVVWVRNYSGSKSSPGMGMKYLEVTPDARALIEEFIAALKIE